MGKLIAVLLLMLLLLFMFPLFFHVHDSFSWSRRFLSLKDKFVNSRRHILFQPVNFLSNRYDCVCLFYTFIYCLKVLPFLACIDVRLNLYSPFTAY